MKIRYFAYAFLSLSLFSTTGRADLTVNSGQTALFSSATVANGETVQGSIILNGGTIVKGYSGEATENIVNNPIVVNANTNNTINTVGSGGSGSWLFYGQMSGSGNIVQTGGSQIHLGNSDNSNFSGTFTTNGSWLSVRNAGAVSKNATYQINSSGVVLSDYTNNSTYHMGMIAGANASTEIRGSSLVLGSVTSQKLVVGETGLSGSFAGKFLDYGGIVLSVEKAGAGTWTLTGDHTNTGATIVSGGVLCLGNGSKFPTWATSKFVVQQNATLEINPNAEVTWATELEFNGGTLKTNAQRTIITKNISGTKMIVSGGAGEIILQNGDGSLTCKSIEVNQGTLTSKRNIASGITVQVNDGGVLQLGNAYASIAVSGTVLYNGGTLKFGNGETRISGVLELAKNYSLTDSTAYSYLTAEATIKVSGGTVTSDKVTSRALELAGGKLVMPGGTHSGSLAVTGDSTLDLGGYLSQTGKLTGTGTLTTVGHGTGDMTSYQIQISGDTSEFSGTLIAGNLSSIGLLGSSKASESVRYGTDGGLLFINSGTNSSDSLYKLGDLFGASGYVRPSGSHSPEMTTLQIGAAVQAGEISTFGGQITDGAKKLAIEKVGAGTWTLSGNNSYSGATTISEGCLNLLGRLSASNVTVANGAAISGSGAIAKDLTILAGGSLLVNLDNPLSLVEPLTVEGQVSFGAGSIIALVDTDPLSKRDQTIEILDSNNPIDYTGVLFDFSQAGGNIWNYGLTADGSGIWVGVDSAKVPEPSTWTLLLLASLGLLGVCRRRK